MLKEPVGSYRVQISELRLCKGATPLQTPGPVSRRSSVILAATVSRAVGNSQTSTRSGTWHEITEETVNCEPCRLRLTDHRQLTTENVPTTEDGSRSRGCKNNPGWGAPRLTQGGYLLSLHVDQVTEDLIGGGDDPAVGLESTLGDDHVGELLGKIDV